MPRRLNEDGHAQLVFKTCFKVGEIILKYICKQHNIINSSRYKPSNLKQYLKNVKYLYHFVLG